MPKIHLTKEYERDLSLILEGFWAQGLVKFIKSKNKKLNQSADEGGITCHAAIVSRELKKPCIIGTRIATKVLKDGDLVEVDANKGIVKILKSYNN